MPRPKRKATTGGGGDAAETPSKKQRSSTRSAKNSGDEQPSVNLSLHWEWEDNEKWTKYSDQHNTQICNAYQNKKKDVTLSISGVSVLINFAKGTQKNKKTGWQRRVRCTYHDTSDDGYYLWEWEDDRNDWNPYNIEQASALEQAKQADNATVLLSYSGSNYSIDMKKMEQENTGTKKIRTIRRKKSDAASPVKKENEDEENDEVMTSASSEDIKPKSNAKSGASKSGRVAKSAGSKSSGMAQDDSKVKTVVIKGKAPVDTECHSKIGVAHVYCEGNDIYDAMLNQTNLKNNNNKYYICQLLEDDKAKRYDVWFRWGRVGKNGQNSLTPCGSDVEKAKQLFCSKFKDKTKNEWHSRKAFTKVPGKYDMLEMDYSTENVKEENESKPKKDVPASKIDIRLQALINLICDVKSMEDAVVEMKYDAKKAPLGKLTTAQIKAGYTALKEIETCIQNNDTGRRLVAACDAFYTRIPHDFGMRTPPLIKTEAEVKMKSNLLEALGDIEIAMKMLREDSKSDENPVDQHYKSLKCGLKPLDQDSPDFKMVEDYLKNTHADTHNHYSMKIVDVFECEKEGEAEKFKKDLGNRKLLWHGSRLTNWCGILQKGLRIAPPEAPVTGYMFGKGVYFADMSSKSANYCFTTRSKNIGLLVLCDVALGGVNELLNANYTANKLPAGKHSVKGLGSVAPNATADFTTSDGIIVPMGKAQDTGVNNPRGYTLNYNEFIVYDTSQIKMKYLIKVKFNYK